jgi:hypothetical protein
LLLLYRRRDYRKIRVKIKKLKLIKKEGVLLVSVATIGLYIGTIIILSSR